MIKDRKAEELESKGLYRRAAARWAEVMTLADGDKEREHAANRRSECIRRAARPPATTDRFGDLRQAVKRTHSALGMDEEARGYFRRYRDKDCQRQ
ncbi:PerC family transcriptional regulator [Escherichia coli]|uniref:PerC family transcriptional regulator n=1 Tax=Escherichia coli TaxID=562 RepID=UPI000D131397|nr:PerC family transcriptional regulator [Escherichia coli]EEZ4499076.1 PerC family transcriptional regulator [Escherichia coli]EFB2656778.1 PerC family transcriptional regulator [Escherichia coli]EFC3531465.1 PerC family transcriptional regulator [Escherichia coli]EFC9344181.1 PerC family transcriptional regulator [Escherichia coli]EFE7530629.1 PerC family transcriptional regulator [Escherichia coli]